MDIVNEIKDAFKKYNPDLYVIAIFNFVGGSYFVIAKHTPDKDTAEDDPFYAYANGKIEGITVTDSPERMASFQKTISPENLIYEIE